MFGGTKKRSTLVDDRVIMYYSYCIYLNCMYRFPREDEGSPRNAILLRFCTSEYQSFRNCMNANSYNENKCLKVKEPLDKCASETLKKINTGEVQFIC